MASSISQLVRLIWIQSKPSVLSEGTLLSPIGDNDRGKNQEKVITAIIKKVDLYQGLKQLMRLETSKILSNQYAVADYDRTWSIPS